MFKNRFNKLAEKIEETIESTKDSIDDISMPVSTTKIAITGLSRAGKTVFISSLIDQFLQQKKIVYVVSKHRPFTGRLLAPKSAVKRFDYYTFSKDIKENAKWPEGTDNITSTIIEFETKSRFSMMGNSKQRIELIDYPGEWILDIAMLELSYDDWADKTIMWMKNLDERLSIEYLETISQLTTDSSGEELEKRLHEQYAEMIAILKKKHYSNLTPGRFLMPSDLAGDPVLMFAPIPKSNSPLYKNYKKRYKTYLKDIVKDIQLEHFRGFDRQIVLIDIVEALQNGFKCYTDMKEGVRSILSLYSHKDKNFISQWFSPSISKVSFVATKADLVASSQHNNYSALLNDMIEDIRRDLDIGHIKTDTQVVAAVKCTQTVVQKHEGRTLSCVRGIDANTQKVVEIYPGEMPSLFPNKENWDTDDYAYEEFLPPNKSYKEGEPFDHIHMDRVIESLIGDLL